jgi:hypothetical protein
MSVEKISSPEENQETAETIQASSGPTECKGDDDCPGGQHCVDGHCVS